MASKRQRRTSEVKAKKKRKTLKLFLFLALVVVCGGFLAFLFKSLSDSILPPSSDEKRERWSVQLYFSDSNERFLVPEKRIIPRPKSLNGKAEELVRALMEGSRTNLVRTLPEGLKLQSVSVDKNGTARVSFDKKFIDDHPGGTASEPTGTRRRECSGQRIAQSPRRKQSWAATYGRPSGLCSAPLCQTGPQRRGGRRRRTHQRLTMFSRQRSRMRRWLEDQAPPGASW